VVSNLETMKVTCLMFPHQVIRIVSRYIDTDGAENFKKLKVLLYFDTQTVCSY